MAKGQAEEEGQQSTLEARHRCDLMGTWRRGPTLEKRNEESGQGMILSSWPSIKEHSWLLWEEVVATVSRETGYSL